MPTCKPYNTCKKCEKDTVHLVTGWVSDFYGDQDDNCGNASKYADEEVGARYEISVGARMCYTCRHTEDVWIEDWPNQEMKRLQARVEELEAENDDLRDSLQTARFAAGEHLALAIQLQDEVDKLQARVAELEAVESAWKQCFSLPFTEDGFSSLYATIFAKVSEVDKLRARVEELEASQSTRNFLAYIRPDTIAQIKRDIEEDWIGVASAARAWLAIVEDVMKDGE